VKSYLETVNGASFVPKQAEDLEILLQTFLMQKAVYELNYELNNRPSWVLVPLRGIKSIVMKNRLEKVQ
jgi:maltose alpha-D-glucosyltransferase/alpha-amylase